MPVELSSELKAKIDQIAALYPRRQAALLPVLHLVQHEFGYLSSDVQLAVAMKLDVPPTLVHEVTTFYEMYHQHPEGQFHLELCTNISCHLAGADQLVTHVKKSLGIEIGHQTEDGVFSLMEAECLASCGSGPMMKVGSDYYEYLTIPACDALIKEFRESASALNGKHYDQGPSGPHVGPISGFDPPSPEAIIAPPPAPEPPPVPVPVPESEKPADPPPTPSTPPVPTSGPSLPTFDPPPLKKKDS